MMDGSFHDGLTLNDIDRQPSTLCKRPKFVVYRLHLYRVEGDECGLASSLIAQILENS